MVGSEITAETTQSVTELLFSCLPYYLSIGMSADEFWNGDYRLAKAYRKADELRLVRANQMAWLQGMYIYERVGDLSPIIGFNLSKNKQDHKPIPYRSEPIPVTKDEFDERKKREQELKEERMKARFREFINNMKIKKGDNSNG